MSSLFRTSHWAAFGRRHSQDEEDRGGGARAAVVEVDESFDVGSNLPIYMSQKEAGEWRVSMDENYRIMEDENVEEKATSEVTSVVSGSTVTESREFWLNCLKENGVDMNASYLQPSPRSRRRTSSLSSPGGGLHSSLPSPRFPLPSPSGAGTTTTHWKSHKSPSRFSPEPLAPRDRNSLLWEKESHAEKQESCDEEKLVSKTDPTSRTTTTTTRSSVPLYRENGGWEASSSSLPPLGKMSPPAGTSSSTTITLQRQSSALLREQPPLLPPDRVTAERRSKSPSWKAQQSRQVFVAQVVHHQQSPPETYIRDSSGFFDESAAVQPNAVLLAPKNHLSNTNDERDGVVDLIHDQPDDEAAGSLPSEIYIKSSADSYDSSLLLGAQLLETHTASEDEDAYFAEIQAALTSGSLETHFTQEEEELGKSSSGLLQVTTVRTESDISSTGFTAPPERRSTTEYLATEKGRLNTSVDLRFSHPDLWTADPSQTEKVKTVKKDSVDVVTPKHVSVAKRDKEARDDNKIRIAVNTKKETITTTSNVDTKVETQVQKSELVNQTESLIDDLEEPDFGNDEYSWMYQVWYRKGLLKTKTVSLKKPIHSKLAVKTSGIKVEKRVPEKPIPTPKDALVSLDYQALQADGPDEGIVGQSKRQSLPADIRMSSRKEGGRKSFDNIRKMWQTKTDDRPNSFFSPEAYMNTRRESHNPGRSRPTQHAQLLSIAERTAVFEGVRGTKRTPPIPGERKVTPRSMSVDSAKKLAGTNYGYGADSKKSSNLTYSPTRDSTIEEQLQSNRRKSDQSTKLSPKKEVENKRRETLNPANHFRRPNIGRSSNDYKSMIKKDYKSIVRTFLESVEEHRVLGEEASHGSYKKSKKDGKKSNMDTLDRIPNEIVTDETEEMEGLDAITPKNLEIKQTGKRSTKKDSPWTQQVVNKLNQVPVGSDGKSNGWRRQERPWREDLVKRKVSDFSECVSVVGGAEDGVCTCSTSVFSGNDELIEFFLPIMGMACICGKRPLGLSNPEEPTSLDNILRPWQVKFLAAFGIHRGDQLVKAHHRSAKALANALRQYRRKHGMTPFRTKSCGMALQIWSKTSKSYVRSIRKQLLTGTSELKAPNTLYIISSFLEKMHEMHSPMPRNPNTARNDEASL